MMHLSRLLLLVLASTAVALYALADAPGESSFFDKGQVRIETEKGSFPVKVEVASTPDQHERGLMYRQSLGEDEGMLFIFPQQEIVNMWMKNTYIPLDMLFVNREGEIVSLQKNAPPLSKNIISSNRPVKMVVELPAGSIARLGITTNDHIRYSPDP